MQFWTIDYDVSQCIFLGLKVDLLRYTMEAKLNLPILFLIFLFSGFGLPLNMCVGMFEKYEFVNM